MENESGPGPAEETGTGKEQGDGALEALHTAADTVGQVPNLRKKDNIIQGMVVAIGTLVAAAVGLLVGGGMGAGIGALAGLVGSLLLSGGILMVLGWVRTVKKLKK